MNILLSNDDSHDSPFFKTAIALLADYGELTIVVPAQEQSWRGKCMTRHGELALKEIEICGHVAYSIDGSPADCVNAGIHHICDTPPDLVVSGINLGHNVGLGYVFSSGTVGACLEANINGLPAIALSQQLPADLYHAWNNDRQMPAEQTEHLRLQTKAFLDALFTHLTDRDALTAEPITWNVNFPFQAADDWSIRPAVVGQTYYGSCFSHHGDHIRHNGSISEFDPSPDADNTILAQGMVTLSRLDIRTFGSQLPTL